LKMMMVSICLLSPSPATNLQRHNDVNLPGAADARHNAAPLRKAYDSRCFRSTGAACERRLTYDAQRRPSEMVRRGQEQTAPRPQSPSCESYRRDDSRSHPYRL
jgi:hypothetical protein